MGVKSCLCVSVGACFHETLVWKLSEYSMDAQIYSKSRNYLKILGSRRLKRNKFHTEDPQVLATTVVNVVATVVWRPGFVHNCTNSNSALQLL